MKFLFLAPVPVHLLVYLAVCWGSAHSAEYSISVKGGAQGCRNLVVRIPLDVDGNSSPHVAISGADFQVMGQITGRRLLGNGSHDKELCFVLPWLAAGQTVDLIGKSVGPDQVTHGFRLDRDPKQKYSELSVGGRPVLRYMCEQIDRSSPERLGETYKVFHHVYDPTGSHYVTKGPGGLFPHHRGLFFGFNRISYGDNQQADIWHCKDGERQAHAAFISEEVGSVVGRERLSVDWHGRDDKVFARELREMSAFNVEDGILIEFASVLTTAGGRVRLDGDPQHAGFQFRGSQEIPDKTKHLTYYVRPDGKGQPGKFRNWSAKKEDQTEENLRHIDLPWLALNFVLGGKHYTCCYLDHPSNPKPARFSERDYGRFGSYFEYDLDEGNPLELNYRIWLQEGEMSVDRINQFSHSFVSAPMASVTVVKK